MAEPVTRADLNDLGQKTSVRLNLQDERIDVLENMVLTQSTLVSGADVTVQTLRMDVSRLDKKLDAGLKRLDSKIEGVREELLAKIEDVQSEMRTGFAKMDVQFQELRSMLVFLIKQGGTPYTPQPPAEER